MIEILEKLIAIDTTTANDTLAAAEFVRDFLMERGVSSRLIYNAAKSRAGLIATIGDPDNSGIILSGHLDTVPADKNDWSTDPWVLARKGGRLYGRGTTDMKGAIATALSLASAMVESGKTFHIVLTHDEECGSSGIDEILDDEDAKKVLARAVGCIVMEPTCGKIVIGQKTVAHGTIEVGGVAAHSANPLLGVNALWHAHKIYEIFYEVLRGFQNETDDMFTVPNAVCDICQMTAGRAVNIIPDRAEMRYTARFLEQGAQEEFFKSLDRAMKEYAKGVDGLDVRNIRGNAMPGFNTDANDAFVRRLLSFAPLADAPKVSYGTEAGCFAELGIPTVVLGPGNIAQAHTKDEFIEIEELENFEILLRKLICRNGQKIEI